MRRPALAHNLLRRCARLGHVHPTAQLTVAATVRNRLLTVPARLLNHSGHHLLLAIRLQPDLVRLPRTAAGQAGAQINIRPI